VHITARLKHLDKVLEKFIDLKCFRPVASAQIIGHVHGSRSFVSENPCTSCLNELSEIEKQFEIDILSREVDNIDYTFEQMKNIISSIHTKLNNNFQDEEETKELLSKYKDALIQVNNIASLDISLDDIFSCEYIDARVGRLPQASVDQLQFYRSRPFIFISFSTDKNYNWCMYFTTSEYEREVDNVFSSLLFERIFIPDFVHGTPEAAKETLSKEINVVENQLASIKNDLHEILLENDSDFIKVKSELVFLNRLYEAKKYVVGLGDKFTITGFIDEKDELPILDKFKDMKDVEINILPGDADLRLKPPKRVKRLNHNQISIFKKIKNAFKKSE